MPENISVMIIEDDFRISAIHRQIVEKIAGFTVVKEAKTAKEAMAYLQGIPQAPDLILLDVYIPDVAGLDLFWQLRMQYRLTSLIVITAAQEMETVRAAIVGGVFDYMTKPLDANRLEQSLLSFQEKHAFLTARKKLQQQEIDYIIGTQFLEKPKDGTGDDLPKGVDPITLNDVKAILRETSEGITAIELSEQTGMGRSTARRYLEYLVSVKMLRASVKYGTVGRPERLYSLRGVYEQNGSNKK